MRAAGISSGEGTADSVQIGRDALISISRSEIEALIAEAVDKGSAPLNRLTLQQSKASPSLKDIISGVIGWILGLFGIGAFVARKKEVVFRFCCTATSSLVNHL